MTIFNTIKVALESEDPLNDLPVTPAGTSEQAIQLSVLEDLENSNKAIASTELSMDKVFATKERLEHYAEVLTNADGGVSQESFDLIAYGLESALSDINVRMTDKMVGLESFSVAQSVADAYDLRSDEDKFNDVTNDIANGNVQEVTQEADDTSTHSDDDINAGIDEGEKKAKAAAAAAEGDGTAPTTTEVDGGEGTGSTDGVGAAEGDGLGDGTEGTGEDQPAATEIPPEGDAAAATPIEGEGAVDETGQPHQPVPEPDALAANNDPTPTINMTMREGEVQISIESIDNIHGFVKRMDIALEGFLHEIFRTVYEKTKQLIGGYESTGRTAEKLKVQLAKFLDEAKASGRTEVDYTIVHADRLVYKGKIDTQSILDGQDALRGTFKKLLTDLPKITGDLISKANKVWDEVKATPEDKVLQKDFKEARILYRDYKQSLVHMYPHELPGGYHVEYDDWGFGWSELKKYSSADSTTFLKTNDLHLLTELLDNVIDIAKIFSTRKAVLDAIQKQYEESKAFAKREQDNSDINSDVLLVIRDIEKAHYRAIADYFEIVFKHSMSVCAYINSVLVAGSDVDVSDHEFC